MIPKEMRDELGLEPGRPVRVETDEDGKLTIQPVLEPDEFLEQMTGVVNDQTRRSDVEPIDPLELKRMWEPSP